VPDWSMVDTINLLSAWNTEEYHNRLVGHSRRTAST
jgi:hypothetical protein